MTRFSVLTLFPEQVEQGLSYSVVGRAIEANLLSLNCRNIRDFAVNKHGQVDDGIYGGGTGMLMMVEPIIKSWLSLYEENPGKFIEDLPQTMSLEEWQKVRKSVSQDKVYFLSPKGKVFNQAKAMEMAKEENIVFLCGHYEGVDQRALDILEAEEISLGDFVLTGGEPAVVVMIDAIARTIPGVLPNKEAYMEDSHAQGYLEEVQYTRPSNWRGLKVPDVLLSGHQAKIDEFRKLSQMKETMDKRPDLVENMEFTEKDWLAFLENLEL